MKVLQTDVMATATEADSGSKGGKYQADFPDSPHTAPGFEIRTVPESNSGVGWNADDAAVAFVPDYYPDRFRQNKDKDLKREGKQCAGESVSVKTIKNRDFHIQGVLLEYEVTTFQQVVDHEGPVEIISPLTPSGGMECLIKSSELGDTKGYDPHARQWQFEYTLDLVSTGKDEYDRSNNVIVSEIIDGN